MIIPFGVRETKTTKQEAVAEFRVWAGVVFFAVFRVDFATFAVKVFYCKDRKER